MGILKKAISLILGTLLILTSCAPDMNEEEIVKKKDDTGETETSIVPSYQLSDEMYQTILPYRPGAARGVIVRQMGNRLDIEEMAMGLRRHSKEYFDPEKYFFEEGQYLTKDMMWKWLDRAMTNKQIKQAVEDKIALFKKNNQATEKEIQTKKKEYKKQISHVSSLALNPAIKNKNSKNQQNNNPKYLSHILEQNYLKKKKDNSVELIGMSIGIAMKSVYKFSTEEAGPYYKDIDKDVMLKKGKKIAQEVLKRIREMKGLADIPIMIAIYREEEESSLVPGNYVTKTTVEGGDTTIGEWEPIQEDFILFPSDEGKEKHFDDQQLVKDFGTKIAEYFPNYVGVIGEGFYINKELKKITLDIPVEFNGKGELIGFTQYTYGLVKEMFQNYYALEVRIKSNKKMESIIYRDAGENKPKVHIFH